MGNEALIFHAQKSNNNHQLTYSNENSLNTTRLIHNGGLNNTSLAGTRLNRTVKADKSCVITWIANMQKVGPTFI